MLMNTRGAPLKPEEIPPGTCKVGMVGGRQVAVFNVGGQFYATQTDCTHMGGPLCEGSLAGEVVTCPWHGSQFNVRTGEVVQGPAREPIETYAVGVRDGVVTT